MDVLGFCSTRHQQKGATVIPDLVAFIDRYHRSNPGDDVRALQQALKATGLKMKMDGIYGPDTEAAVRTLQGEKGLGVTVS